MIFPPGYVMGATKKSAAKRKVCLKFLISPAVKSYSNPVNFEVASVNK
jgi:hypothetical protein